MVIINLNFSKKFVGSTVPHVYNGLTLRGNEETYHTII